MDQNNQDKPNNPLRVEVNARIARGRAFNNREVEQPLEESQVIEGREPAPQGGSRGKALQREVAYTRGFRKD